MVGGLVLAASGVQVHAQQYWPNPYFQYPAPMTAPMVQPLMGYPAVQPGMMYYPQAMPMQAVRAPVAIQPVRYEVPTLMGTAEQALPAVAAQQPAAPLPLAAAAEPLAPAAAAPAAATQAPSFVYNDNGNNSNSGTISFGAGIDIVKPHWKTNPAFVVFSIDAAGVRHIVQTDFSYDASAAPFLWVAFQGQNGMGARARSWWYKDNQDLSLVNDGTQFIASAAPLGLRNTSLAAGDVLTFSSSLRLQTVDLEATYGTRGNGWSLLGAAGARYGYISQEYNHSEVPVGGVGVVETRSGHNFSGAGPTLAVEGRYAIGNSGFSLLGSTRGSMLFGNSRQIVFGAAAGVLEVDVEQSNDDLLPIWDVELGGEYARTVGNATWFVQAAFVSQVWFGAGNSTNNELIPVLVDPEVSDKNADLGLYGLRITGGVRY